MITATYFLLLIFLQRSRFCKAKPSLLDGKYEDDDQTCISAILTLVKSNRFSVHYLLLYYIIGGFRDLMEQAQWSMVNIKYDIDM